MVASSSASLALRRAVTTSISSRAASMKTMVPRYPCFPWKLMPLLPKDQDALHSRSLRAVLPGAGVHARPVPDHRKVMALCGREAESDCHLTQDLRGVIVQVLVVVVLHNQDRRSAVLHHPTQLTKRAPHAGVVLTKVLRVIASRRLAAVRSHPRKEHRRSVTPLLWGATLTSHRRGPDHPVAQKLDVLLSRTQDRQLRSGSNAVVDPRAVGRRAHDRVDGAVLQRKAPTVAQPNSNITTTVVVVSVQARGQLRRRQPKLGHDFLTTRA